jgi:hypothetical protein
LTDENENDISTLLNSSFYQVALEGLSGVKIVGHDVSESALLHAIFEAGMSAVKESAELAGYAQIAAKQSKPTLAQDRKDARRRQPSWAEEE